MIHKSLLIIVAAFVVVGCAAETFVPDPTALPPTEPPVEATQEPALPPPTDLPAATTTPEVELTPIPQPEQQELSILLVTDDFLSATPEFSSAAELAEIMDQLDISYDTWSTFESETPPLETLNQYDLVMWSGGADCCDSPTQQSIDAISEYIDDGGWLFIDSLSVGYAYRNTRFTREYLHADGGDFNIQSDVRRADHPITEGLGEDDIRFSEMSTFDPDVLIPREGAEPVLYRGSGSAREGDPTMIAFDDGRNRVVYAAFPIKWLPAREREILVENTFNWFGRPQE